MADLSEVDGFSTDTIRAELARIVASELFRSSQVLRNLLTYIVEARLTDASDSLKEYTLATQVLNQPATFDPRVNNVVRVHAHRLRQRLHDYYGQEGNANVLIVDLPKGGYVPHFIAASDNARSESNTKQETEGASVSQAEASAEAMLAASPERLSRIRPWHLAIAGLAGVGLGLAFAWILFGMRGQDSRGAASATTRQLGAFWGPIWNNHSPTTIAIANRTFLMGGGGAYIPYTGPQTGLPGEYMADKAALSPYANRKLLNAAGRVQFNDAITGIGEAEAAFILGKAFSRVGRSATIRRGRLLQMHDIQNGNVIFLGAPVGQPLLESLLGSFEFQIGGSGIQKVKLHKVDRRYIPQRDPKSGALLDDYGLIAVLPGETQGNMIVVLAGDWTYGTLAAAEFVTEPAGIAALLAYPGLAKSGHLPPYFEAVVRVELVQGQLGQIQLIAAQAVTSPGVR